MKPDKWNVCGSVKGYLLKRDRGGESEKEKEEKTEERAIQEQVEHLSCSGCETVKKPTTPSMHDNDEHAGKGRKTKRVSADRK